MLTISHLAVRIMRASHDPEYASAREQLAHELYDWHGGPISGLYAVATAWLEGREPSSDDAQRASDELQRLLDEEVPSRSEIPHVRELKRRLEEESGN